MRKHILLCMFIPALLFSFSGLAVAVIAGGPHDFTPGTHNRFYGTNDQYCIYCHTPHNGTNKDSMGNYLPLWNRNLPTETFTMYTSPTLQQQPPSAPLGYSLLCLSCHDGVSTLGTVINNGAGGTSITWGYGSPTTIGALSYPQYMNPNIGRDLSSDHPISIMMTDTIYGNNPATGIHTIADMNTLSSNALILYGNKPNNNLLECPTCHDPHNYGSPDQTPFLRMSNAGSGMCLSCHIK